MVLKVNNKLMPFSSFGGSRKRSNKIKKRKNRALKSKRRGKSSKKRYKKRSRSKSKSKQKGGYIRARSPVFNWGDKCQNTGKPFNLEK